MELDRVAIVLAWQDAVSSQNVDGVLDLSAPDIEVTGPRGSGYGHQLLRDWMARAGLVFETQRIFVRDNMVVIAQHGTWHAPETRAVTGEAEIASLFKVEQGKITKFIRYDDIDAALNEAGLSYADEVSES